MWLRDIARALNRSGLAGLVRTQELLMGEFCPYSVHGQMEGLHFAFAVPRMEELLVCVLCRGSAVLQIATALQWSTLTELRVLLNPHFLLPWCLSRVATASQIYANWRDRPPEFLRPLSSTVESAVDALRGAPLGDGVLLTFCQIPGWEPRVYDADTPPVAYAGDREWSHPVPLLAKERSKFRGCFFVPDVRPA